MVRIIFHRNKCIGCNACVEAAPWRWRVSHKDGRCNLVDAVQKKQVHIAEVSYDELSANEEAARNCPAGIIRVEA
ncbi:MAG: ferredoxin [Balneolia bacterium]|nr:ferredoxin [Balneolia bacterium]